MVHAGVAHYGHVQYRLALDTGLSGDVFNDSIETINYRLVQLLQTLWVGHGIANAGHDIFTIDHLRIHH
ncbi:hypothetical protein ES703_117094 [subsurface metagenome]